MNKKMRGIKIYLTIVTILLVLAVGAGVYVWYKLQSLQLSPSELPSPTTNSKAAPGTGTPTQTAATGTITIPTSALTDGQKATLKAFGIDPNSFALTENEVACAKQTLGDTRFAEIKGGASPTPYEAFKLTQCIK